MAYRNFNTKNVRFKFLYKLMNTVNNIKIYVLNEIKCLISRSLIFSSKLELKFSYLIFQKR